MSASTSQAAPQTSPPSDFPKYIDSGDIHVTLTYDALSPQKYIDQVRSPHAGATVLFLGTTRDSFNKRPVSTLSYSAYAPLALKSVNKIATEVLKKHNLTAISIVHRLGEVKVGEESIVIAISSKHRQEAWKAGEECLEEVKEKVEIWKMEVFDDEEGGAEWRANRDGKMGEKVVRKQTTDVDGESAGKGKEPMRRKSSVKSRESVTSGGRHGGEVVQEPEGKDEEVFDPMIEQKIKRRQSTKEIWEHTWV